MQPELEEIEPGIIWKDHMPKYDAVAQKTNQIIELRKNYDIIVAIDDRPDICQAYWNLGVHAMLVKFPEHNCQGLSKENVSIR